MGKDEGVSMKWNSCSMLPKSSHLAAECQQGDVSAVTEPYQAAYVEQEQGFALLTLLCQACAEFDQKSDRESDREGQTDLYKTDTRPIHLYFSIPR